MMRRNVRYSLYVILGLISASLGAQAQQTRPAPPLEFRELAPGLYQTQGGQGANGGVFIGDDAVLVIDAKQTEESQAEVFAEIAKLSDKSVRFLVNTHSDGDHVAGNRYFPPEVTMIAQENCRAEFFHPGRDGSRSGWESPELAPFVPSVTYSEKMTLHLGTKIVELHYFGVGHTKGDSVVYFPDHKVAFLGDQIFIGRPQLIHSYKGGNSFGHVKVLETMLQTLDADVFCSGHGEPVDRSAIHKHIDGMIERQRKVKALMAENKTLEEIKLAFEENESRLVESIFNELSANK